MDVEWSWGLGVGLELTRINHKSVLSLQFLSCFNVFCLLSMLLCRLSYAISVS